MMAHNALAESQHAAALDRLIAILAERAADEWLAAQGLLPATPKQKRHDTSRNLRTLQHRPTS